MKTLTLIISDLSLLVVKRRKKKYSETRKEFDPHKIDFSSSVMQWEEGCNLNYLSLFIVELSSKYLLEVHKSPPPQKN